MLTIPACSVAESLFRRLHEEPVRLAVHSTFARAWNLTLGGGLLLTIANVRSGNLPGGVLLSEEGWTLAAAAGVQAGDIAITTPHYVELPSRDLRLSLGSAPAWRPNLELDQEVAGRELSDRIQEAELFFREGAERHGMPPLEAALERYGSAMEEALRSGDHERVDKASERLVGLGMGLTPSGDDMLVGTLLALRLLAPRHPSAETTVGALVVRLRRLAGNTTAVAASYLLYACDGEFSEVALNFARDLLTPNNDWRASAAKLRSLGATSGSDLGRGVILAVRAIRDGV